VNKKKGHGSPGGSAGAINRAGQCLHSQYVSPWTNDVTSPDPTSGRAWAEGVGVHWCFPQRFGPAEASEVLVGVTSKVRPPTSGHASTISNPPSPSLSVHLQRPPRETKLRSLARPLMSPTPLAAALPRADPPAAVRRAESLAPPPSDTTANHPSEVRVDAV